MFIVQFIQLRPNLPPLFHSELGQSFEDLHLDHGGNLPSPPRGSKHAFLQETMRPPLLHVTRSGCDDECGKEETEFRIVEARLGMCLGSTETWTSCQTDLPDVRKGLKSDPVDHT